MIEDYIEDMMRQEHIPGLSLAIIQAGTPLVARGFGLANVELDVPASQDSVYEIASVTKTFTAAAVMLAVEENRLALDALLGDCLPDLPPAWRAVTIQQLLTHTSGIKNYTDVAAYWKTTRLDISKEEILGLVRDAPLDFPPGSNWSYSNTGFYLLGLVLERLYGAPYGEVLRARIFHPLGMDATRANDPYEPVKGRAAGYTWQNDRLRRAEYYSPSGTYAAGVLLSSIADLIRWDAALASASLLSKASLERMWTPLPEVTPGEQQFGFRMGLGWFLFDLNGHKVLRHNGNIKGFVSEIARFLDDRLTIILCCNLDSGRRTDLIINELAAFYIPGLG